MVGIKLDAADAAQYRRLVVVFARGAAVVIFVGAMVAIKINAAPQRRGLVVVFVWGAAAAGATVTNSDAARRQQPDHKPGSIVIFCERR